VWFLVNQNTFKATKLHRRKHISCSECTGLTPVPNRASIGFRHERLINACAK
jgi:hypothetical protein